MVAYNLLGDLFDKHKIRAFFHQQQKNMQKFQVISFRLLWIEEDSVAELEWFGEQLFLAWQINSEFKYFQEFSDKGAAFESIRHGFG